MRGKPRVIRKVTKVDAKGRAKIATDRKSGIRMERVTARTRRDCCYHACQRGFIAAGVEYAKVHANEGRPKFIRGRAIYSPRDYHFECVPPAARPLVRFLVSRNPKSWQMLLCPDSFSDKPLVKMRFESPEEWREWLTKNHPRLMADNFKFVSDDGYILQHGTGSYWSTLTRTTQP